MVRGRLARGRCYAQYTQIEAEKATTFSPDLLDVQR
jgi:hypothetical protein